MGTESTSIEFPVNSTSASYPEKGWFVTTDALVVTREIENTVNNSKQFMAQVPYHEKVIKDGPSLIMAVSQEKKMEFQQAEKINRLESQLSAMSERMEQMVSLLSASVPANHKSKKEE